VGMANSEIALANGDAVVSARATARAPSKHFAEVVQSRRRHFILTTAGEGETSFALGEL
jgi:hypothetical protein